MVYHGIIPEHEMFYNDRIICNMNGKDQIFLIKEIDMILNYHGMVTNIHSHQSVIDDASKSVHHIYIWKSNNIRVQMLHAFRRSSCILVMYAVIRIIPVMYIFMHYKKRDAICKWIAILIGKDLPFSVFYLDKQ